MAFKPFHNVFVHLLIRQSHSLLFCMCKRFLQVQITGVIFGEQFIQAVSGFRLASFFGFQVKTLPFLFAFSFDSV